MRIIVDGNDGVGKTTLIKKLQKDLDIKSYIHLSSKDRADYDFYSALLDKQDVIFDRSFISERVYSHVLNRPFGSRLAYFEEDRLYRKAFENNYIIIIATSEEKVYSEGEFEAVIAKADNIDAYFEAVVNKYKDNIIRYDTRNSNYEELVDLIKERFKDEKLH